jgi:NADPH:quinone reductase-like Zn-dependent oxidoreductase
VGQNTRDLTPVALDTGPLYNFPGFRRASAMGFFKGAKMKKLQGIFLILLMCLGGTVFADDQVTVLVTGANRGIGLEYAKQLSAKGYTVIGTARNPDEADELDVVADRVEQLDVADPQSVAAC